MHRSTLKYTLTAVLATGAIATSPALAMPIDGPVNRGDSPSGSLAGTTEKNLKKQDLRGELAKDRYFQAGTPDKVQPGQPVQPLGARQAGGAPMSKTGAHGASPRPAT